MSESTEIMAHGKTKIPPAVAEAIVEMTTKTAIDVWREKEEQQKKEWRKERINETKRLLKSYRMNKIALEEEDHYTDVEKAEMRLRFLEDLMGKPENGLLRSERQIYNNEHRIAKREFEIQRVDQVMRMYKRDTDLSASPEQQRRYRIVCMRYLHERPMEIGEIEEAESVSEKTVYRDLQCAVDAIAGYLYGY